MAGASSETLERGRKLRSFMFAYGGLVWPLVAFLLLMAAGSLLLWGEGGCEFPATPWVRRSVTLLLFLWVGWIYAWVVSCFAGDAYEQRTRSIQFAYFFVILSFVAVSMMIANIDRASTFGVVVGCVDSAEETSFVPIRCDYPQRLRVPAPQNEPTRGERTAAARSGAEANAGPGAAGAPGEGYVWVAEPTFEQRVANAARNHNYHHLLNIGGRVDDIDIPQVEKKFEACRPKIIHGGVPVPVYFILLAFIGAAISLARNVPVIQRRSEESYVTTAAEPRLLPGEVRELLAFQILQFVSAPFLAVAAYHTLKPESLATTVALGFLTGFASEKILSLLSVRIGDTKGTLEAPAVLAGQVYGKVKRGAEDVSGATVLVDGLDKVQPARTDANGNFKLFGVPVSPQAYLLKAKFTTQQGIELGGALSVALTTPSDVDAGTIELKG